MQTTNVASSGCAVHVGFHKHPTGCLVLIQVRVITFINEAQRGEDSLIGNEAGEAPNIGTGHTSIDHLAQSLACICERSLRTALRHRDVLLDPAIVATKGIDDVGP